MVLIVIVPADAAVQRAIAAGEEVLLGCTVLHDEVAEIVDGVLRKNLSGRQLVRLSAPNGDARNGGIVNGAQFPSRGAIDILRHVSVVNTA